MVRTIFFKTVVLAAMLAAVFAGARIAEGAESLYILLFDEPDEMAYREVLQITADTDGRALHRFPYEAMIVEILPSVADELADIPGVFVSDQVVEDIGTPSPTKEAAVLAWNVFFRGEPSPLTEPWTEDAPYYREHGSDAIVLDKSELDTSAVHRAPYGASSTETSEFFCGSVTVAVFTMESNGGAENWTSGEIANVKAEILQGLNNWITREPNANLTFTYVYNDQTATVLEPIQGTSTADALWMQEAMTTLGYTDVNVWVNLFNYANDLRNTYGTDWAYSVFVVDDTNDSDKMFSNLWSAYAYLGGPAVVMTYDNGTALGPWWITRMDMVFSHETAHIFYALDEYFGSCQNCAAPSGYLWVQNQNCNLTGSGGCAINQNCVMRDNNIANRCPNTRGQLGTIDTDGDTIPDVRDTFPQTQLNPFTPNPTALTSLVYTGQASVSPLPRVGGTGNNISINTIAGVSYRVGGAGSWYPATPSDGAFDGPVESYTFTLGPLAPGTYLVETKARNDVANSDATPATDSVQVVVGPTAAFTENPVTGTAPLTVDFTDASTGYVTSWSWFFGDGDASSQQNPSHEYTDVGTHTVALAASGGGVTDTLTKTDLIQVTCPGPSAAFSASPTSGMLPLDVAFTDASAFYAGCDITSWQWDFGDGGTSDAQNPVHTYDEVGDYTVSLTVTNAAGSDTEIQNDLIIVTPPADDDAADDSADDDDDVDDVDDVDDDDDDTTPTGGDDDDGGGDDDSSGCCGC